MVEFLADRQSYQLKDQSLFIEKAYVNGEWIGAQSGETFEVHGAIAPKPPTAQLSAPSSTRTC